MDYMEVSHEPGENIEEALMGLIFECVKDKFELKDKFMSFLLHLNEDFDDDLLLDALELLVDL
jgi:hypothetical protein